MIRALFAALTLLIALPASAQVNIQPVTSPGGITAWLVEDHSIPFTALELRFKGGANLDAPGKRGAINLMTGLLEEGAGELDAQSFATAQQDLAASFGFDVYDDALSVSARFLTENRDQAIDLLRQALVAPRFDPAAVERVRGQVRSIIQADANDPQDKGSAAWDKSIYGDHPYATSLNGTIDSVAALTRDDLIAAKDRVMARDRVFVAATGDITPADLGKLLDRLLGDLPATGAPMPQDATVTIQPGITVIEHDSPQSYALFGHAGLKRDDPDFFAAYLLNQILGGRGFDSRLMTEVRVKRGLTYGIYSFLVPRDHAALMLGSLQSSNEKIAEAIEVIRQEWRHIAETGVTETELSDAKTYLTGSYPLRFSGNGPIADILVGMQQEGLPIDYPNTRNAQVDAVTRADIARVAERLLDPDGLKFVVVGRPEGLPDQP